VILILTFLVTSVNSRVYLTATDSNGQNIVVADSGQFLNTGTGGDLYGLMMVPGNPSLGNTACSGGYSTTSNTVNYSTGTVIVTFPTAIPSGTPINAQSYFYNQGIPRGVLFYNNTLSLFPPSNISYLVELDAYFVPRSIFVD